DVYVRLKDGILTDSVNNQDGKKLLHTAAFTGNFEGLEFLDDDGNRYDIASWTPQDSKGELDYVGGGIYEKTFHMKELADNVEVRYKVAFDDSWDYSIGDGANNYAVTIPKGTTEFTVLCDEINGVVYDSVRTPAFEVAQNSGAITKSSLATKISIIGSVRGGDDWEAAKTGFEFTPISDTLYRYQKTFAKGTYDYKCVFDYEKWYEAEADNRRFEVNEDNTNVVFLYDTKTGKLTDSVNNTNDVAKALGMQVAPAKAKVSENTNGTVQFVTVADNATTVKLVYGIKSEVEKSGEAALKTVDCSKLNNGGYAANNLFIGDAAADIVYYYVIDGAPTLDAAATSTTEVKGSRYSVYKKAAFKGRSVNVPGTFPGPSWNEKSNPMTYKGNGLYECTFKDVPAANYEYKIAMGSWSENYGKGGSLDGANISLTVPSTQDVTVYYNDFTHNSVTSVNYIFADVLLKGSGIPDGTKLEDSGLTGIYTAVINMKKGSYDNIEIVYNGKTFKFETINVNEDKAVTFYFDPVSELFYCNASGAEVRTENISYDSRDLACKSVYGAVATGESVKFTITTGTDVTEAKLVMKGVDTRNIDMKKDGEAVNGKQQWSVTTKFDTIGENHYYFALLSGTYMTIYADDDGNYGKGMVTDLTNVKPYDLVVYKDGFETPDWMKNAVIYQIFPDRFYNGDTSNDFAQTSSRGEVDYEYISDWNTLPENPEQETEEKMDAYKATGAYVGDGNWSNEIYGGDLKGITERIDYLKALGVNVIYLNPVFASISSHRYDTSDYNKIDPILGDLGDFEELTRVAEENGMHVVLDGVFNHVSDDSKYFDRYYKYLEAGTDKVGAYPYWAYVYDTMAEQNVSEDTAKDIAKKYFADNYGITDFSYTEWFNVTQETLKDDNENDVTDNIGLRAGKTVYGYEGWWGYDSMPVIKATNGSEYQTGNWAEEIIGNDDGTSVGQYWISEGSDGWRLDVANEVSDETWQNFRNSVKALNNGDAVIIGEIWTDATDYLLGDMYDSVMNYVFRNAVLGYAKGGSASDATAALERIRERYPEEAFYAMMNLVGSHDTTRLLSYLDGIDDDRNQKEIDKAFPTYENTSDTAKQRQYLVAFLQFTYAGAPTIYYGDEIGMTGADDPDDRRAFTWGKGSKELVTWYAKLADIRSQYSALRTGSVEPIDVNDDAIMGYVRSDDNDIITVLGNNADSAKEITVSIGTNATSKITDIVSGTSYDVKDGKVKVNIPAYRGVILASDVKSVSVDEAALAPAYDSSYVEEVKTPATTIALDKTTASLKEGEKVNLSATVGPENVTSKVVIWSSSDESIATVADDGTVTAVKAGDVTITAKAAYGKNVTATCDIKVAEAEKPQPTPEPEPQPTPQKVAATTITLDKTTANLKEGETVELKATVGPENATDKSVTWTSSDESVATVSKDGKVTAVKAGSVKITATAVSGKNVTAACDITVTQAEVKKPAQNNPDDKKPAGKQQIDTNNQPVSGNVNTDKSANQTKSPKSGDDNEVATYVCLLGLAAVAITAATYRKKKACK
ncbi:MAG: alpha-amylase family glycosyl hydrolase, partial [Lachnospiraceae bacterium]|nr:alpha-amylase family glycosyl hydrolase [Lachnospiraceae bacterium]